MSMYLDDLFCIDNNHFPSWVNKIYPDEFKLNKANNSEKQANVLDLDRQLFVVSYLKFSLFPLNLWLCGEAVSSECDHFLYA
jgi:hypothetical protein